jgi:L-malate glycosyltransferase
MRLLLAGDIRDLHLRRYADYFQGRGHKVALISAEKHSLYKPDYHIKTVPGPRPVKYLSGIFSFNRIIREFKPDLINCHFLPNYGMLGQMSGFHPLVVSVWGSDILISAVKSALHKFRAKRILNSADLVLSDADLLTKKTKELNDNIPKIVTVPFGVEREVLAKGEKRQIESHGRLRIISTRKLEKLYRVGDLIDALAKLSTDKIWDTIIIGGGSQFDSLLEQKASLGLSGVEFTGPLPHDDLLGLLAVGDLYVSCSTSDSTSVSLLEAMACGLFPIVSDIPGNREWIINGENGFLFPLGDAATLADKISGAAVNIDLRKKALRYNIKLVIEKAIWEENMHTVEREFVALVENR